MSYRVARDELVDADPARFGGGPLSQGAPAAKPVSS